MRQLYGDSSRLSGLAARLRKIMQHLARLLSKIPLLVPEINADAGDAINYNAISPAAWQGRMSASTMGARKRKHRSASFCSATVTHCCNTRRYCPLDNGATAWKRITPSARDARPPRRPELSGSTFRKHPRVVQ